MLAYVAKPDGEGPFPAVIMIHEFYGLNESIIGKAEGLAQEGYYVVAPDTFRGSTTTWIPRAIYQVISTKPENSERRPGFGLRLARNPNRMWTKTESQSPGFATAAALHCFTACTITGWLQQLSFTAPRKPTPRSCRHYPDRCSGIFGGADQSISQEQM